MVRVSAASMDRWSGWAKGAGGSSLPQDELLYLLDNLEIWVAESPSCWAAAHYGQACLGCLEEEWLPPPVTQSWDPLQVLLTASTSSVEEMRMRSERLQTVQVQVKVIRAEACI